VENQNFLDFKVKRNSVLEVDIDRPSGKSNYSNIPRQCDHVRRHIRSVEN
jgi:hypothetical protein